MKIYYQDEYGEELHIAYNRSAVPRIGETVVIKKEEYRVKDVIWEGDGDDVIIEITQNLLKAAKKEEDNSSVFREMKSALSALGNKYNAQEKKQKLLNEQIVSIRTYINSTKQESKK